MGVGFQSKKPYGKVNKMDGDQKFVALFVGIVMFCIFGGLTISEYSKYSCRMELAKSGRSVTEIEVLCK